MKKLPTKKTLALFFLAALFMTPSLFAQKKTDDQLRLMHIEVPDDPYMAAETIQTSPAYNTESFDYYTRQVNVDSNGDNILNDAGNEPSLAVDPTNPNRIVIGWRQFDNISSNFRQAGYGYSTNGFTFTFPGVLDPGLFRSDPVLDFDAQGNFYYNSLQGTFECDVFKIDDGGVVWGDPVPAFGGDKQWMRVDRSNSSGAGHNYSYWNRSFTTCPSDGAFTRSTDLADSFDDCITVDSDPFWGTLAVDRNGDLYITGRTGGDIVVVKSTDAKDAGSPVTWDSVNVLDLDGSLDGFVPINPQGLLGQAWVDVDVSDGPGQDNVYVAASVQRDSNSDPGDVMFARSTDGGSTFEPPIKINTDASTSNYQWFGTMSVAPNGRIDMIWLDTRDNPGTFLSRLYYSFSEDQGDTWSTNEAISEAFDPSLGYPQQNKMGDYFDMKSDNEFAHVAWAATFTGGQDVYYTRISPNGTLGINDQIAANALQLTNYPNPFTESTTISFSIPSESKVVLEVFDINGKKVNTLVDDTLTGKQQVVWNGATSQGAKAQSGLYFIRLKAGNNTQTLKAVIK